MRFIFLPIKLVTLPIFLAAAGLAMLCDVAVDLVKAAREWLE